MRYLLNWMPVSADMTKKAPYPLLISFFLFFAKSESHLPNSFPIPCHTISVMVMASCTTLRRSVLSK